MFLRKIATTIAISLISSSVWAGCAFENNIELKSLSNSFEAFKDAWEKFEKSRT